MIYELAFLKALSATVLLEILSGGGLKFISNRLFFSNYLPKEIFKSQKLKFLSSFLDFRGPSNTKFLIAIASASILTLPYLWFVFPYFLRGTPYIVASEAFAVIIESIFYRLFLFKSLKTAIILSFLTNAFSFFIGNILF
jgi:hypothetical protein